MPVPWAETTNVVMNSNWGILLDGFWSAPRGGTAIPKRWGCAARAPWSTWREREIKKCMVTKKELLNNLSNIYKCKVSPAERFHLEISSSMKERIIRFN